MRWLQTIVRTVVLALVLALFVRTFLAEGLLTRFVVSGASMSPTFHGAHFVLHCPQCATAFSVETDDEAPTLPNELPLRRGICPACAFAQTPVPSDAWRPGDRILVNLAALSLRAIRRWDVVLFRSPEDGQLTVKRVVGLPGETLRIRDGDILINGQIAVKSFTVQRAMRVPVLYGRWETQPGQSPGSFEFAWHPIRNTPHVLPIMETGITPGSPLYGVTSQLCENQWHIEPPGGIFPVCDLMLEFDWQPDDSTPLCIRACAEELQLTTLLATRHKAMHKVVVSLFDRRLLVAVDGIIIIERPMDEERQHSKDSASFAFYLPENVDLSPAEQKATIERQVTGLRVWRDVYYTHANALSTCVTIPADCYYVLGDNSSFSSDSRYWKEPFVAHRHLIGIVQRMSHRQ